MKIRNGFIGNSSSSSFLVLLKDVPKTYQELDLILFGKMENDKPKDFKNEYIYIEYLKQLLTDIKKNENKLFGDSNLEEKKNIFVKYIQRCPQYLKDIQPHDNLYKIANLEIANKYVNDIRLYKEIDIATRGCNSNYDVYSILYKSIIQIDKDQKPKCDKINEIIYEHVFKNCFDTGLINIENYSLLSEVEYGNEIDSTLQQEYMRNFMYDSFCSRCTEMYIICESNNS